MKMKDELGGGGGGSNKIDEQLTIPSGPTPQRLGPRSWHTLNVDPHQHRPRPLFFSFRWLFPIACSSNHWKTEDLCLCHGLDLCNGPVSHTSYAGPCRPQFGFRQYSSSVGTAGVGSPCKS